METKIKDNVILVFIILGMLAIAIGSLFLLTNKSNYVAAVDLNNQTNTISNTSYATFDAGFENASQVIEHSKVGTINTQDTTLLLKFGVTAGGTKIINPTVQFLTETGTTAINFNLGSGFGNITNNSEENYIKSSNNATKTVYFNDLDSMTLGYGFGMTPDFTNCSKTNQTFIVRYTATIQEPSGNQVAVSKDIYVNIGWTANNPTLDLDQTVSKYRRNHSSKTLTVETTIVDKANTGAMGYILPVKQTQLVVDVPTYQGIAPTTVNVKAKQTQATNGKDESNVQFDNNNWNYNATTRKLTITVNNPADSSGNIPFAAGIDEFIVTYTYPQAAYDAFATSGTTIVNKVVGTMTFYSNNSTITGTNTVNKNSNLNVEFGIDTDGFPKVGLYINSFGKADPLAKNIGSRISHRIGSTKNVASYRIEFQEAKLYTDTATYSGFDSTTNINYNPIVKFYISSSSFAEYLGSGGYIKVYDDNCTHLIETITSSRATNSFGQYEVSIPENYQKSSHSFILETSKPISDLKTLEISFDRAITGKPLTLQQIQNLKKTNSIIRFYSSTIDNPTNYTVSGSDLIVNEWEFIDSYTDASINVETSSLSATDDNFQELKVKILLDNMSEYSDAWKTPSFDVEFPEYITEIGPQINITMNNGNNMQFVDDINHGAMNRKDGKLHFSLHLDGYQEGVYANSTSIELTFQVKVNKYTPNVTKDIKLNYINDAVRVYKNESTWNLTGAGTFPFYTAGTKAGLATGEIKFTNEEKVLCVSELSGYNGANTINSMDNRDTVAPITRGSAISPTMTLTIQNNHAVPVSGLTVLGRIPYTNNKYVIAGTDLGTNINTTLAGNLTALTTGKNVTIYYSDNLNATKDITLSTNNWTTTPSNLSLIRSYMIVINDELAVGEQMKFAYNFTIPAGTNYNKNLYVNFGTYYTAAGTAKTSEADKIGLTTGQGPIISVQKTGTIVGGSTTAKEGDIITYTIAVKNTGTEPATNVVLNDPIPTNTTFVTLNESGGYIQDLTKRNYTVNIGALAANETKTYTFSVLVGAINENATIRNIATVSADGIEDIASNPSDISSVMSSPNLKLTKRSNIPEGTKVREGDEIEYIIIVRNDGDGIAKNVIIHDAIPKNTTYWDPTTGTTDPERIRIDSDPKEILRPGEEYEFRFKVIVDPILEDTLIQNAATYTADNDEGGGTSNVVEIPATTSDPILEVIKTSSIAAGSKVKEGDIIEYTITVKNVGYGVAKNIVIKDTLPEGTIYYDETTGTTNEAMRIVNSPVKETLNPNETFTFKFKVKVGRISVGTTIQNTAKVTGDDIPETPSNTVGITADVTVPNLRAVKTSSIAEGAKIKEGDIITYTITVYNDGTTPAYDVSITDKVPEHTTYYEGGVRNKDRVDISKNIPVLNPGENASLSFTVIVDEIPENTTIQNTAKVNAENSPEIPTNTIGIPAEISVPKLKLEKSSSVATGSTVKSGDVIEYTIKVTNTGDCIAHNVVISDKVPANTIYAEKSGSQYIKNASKTEVSKIIETLNPGESETLIFYVIVDKLNANVQITNTAKVNANNGEETPSNTVEISAKPKDDPSTGELPYTGNYSLIIILIIAIVSLSGFAVYEYKRIRK